MAPLTAVVLLLAALRGCDGSLRFASYYGDHMVLQKAPQRAVLWGYAPAGATVTVSLSGPFKQKRACTSATQGIWRVLLDPVDAGGPYNVTAGTPFRTAVLTDVLFGDVWLCGGQSNMYFKTSQVFNASEELALSAKYPHVRTFMAALNSSETELIDLIQVELPWSVPSARILSEFSAVCWLFGRYMFEKLKYPIGLVESCWGGTSVEAWSSPRALKQCGLQQTQNSTKEKSSVLWNAMIHPFQTMTIFGAIWYQGEANADYNKNKYNCSFPAMIDDWRMAFHSGSGGQTADDFPFGFVQLCTYNKGATDDGFPDIRWHQTADVGFVPNYRMKKTFMAVTLDLPDEASPYGTIHPRDKQDVAYRLTLGARAVAYGEQELLYRGPFPQLIWASETLLEINYDQLVSVRPSKDVFEVCCSVVTAPCGSSSRWVPAAVVAWGASAVRLNASLCQPSEVAALRYAWKDWPCGVKACPVYTANATLPAPPFIVQKYEAGKRNIWKTKMANGNEKEIYSKL